MNYKDYIRRKNAGFVTLTKRENRLILAYAVFDEHLGIRIDDQAIEIFETDVDRLISKFTAHLNDLSTLKADIVALS